MTINTKYNLLQEVYVISRVHKFYKGNFIDVPHIRKGTIVSINSRNIPDHTEITYSVSVEDMKYHFEEKHIFDNEDDAKLYLNNLLHKFC